MHRRSGPLLRRLISIIVVSCLLGSCATFINDDPCEGLPPIYGSDC